MTSAIIDQLDTFGPDHCRQLTYEQATEYTRRLTQTHQENFSVVSLFLPRRLREDFRNVYAFCRWADDLADQAGDRKTACDLLSWWRCEIDACYGHRPRHPVFVALYRTIDRHQIPREPFDHLVDAFVQDQTVTRYDSWPQVLDYCTRSANPVGRLVLYLCGYQDQTRQRLSDATCSALQLTNFWQDVRRDILERDRVYIPADIAAQHRLDIPTMVRAVKLDAAPAEAGCCGHGSVPGIHALREPFCATIRDLVDRTWPLFQEGRSLWPMVRRDVRLDIQLFTIGGESVLKRIGRVDYNTLAKRPRLSRSGKVALVFAALAMNLTGWTPRYARGRP